MERIAYAVRFMRLKRGLSQEELAKMAVLSQSALTAVESMSQKIGVKTIEQFLYAIGIQLEFLEDKGLYETSPELQKFKTAKVVCAIIDAYCYSIPEDIVKKLIGSDKKYITSKEMADLLLSLSEDNLSAIFNFPSDPVLLAYLVAKPAEIGKKEFQFKLIEAYIKEDPFYKLLKLLGVEFTDYYAFLFDMINRLSMLKKLSLCKLHNLNKKLFELDSALNEL